MLMHLFNMMSRAYPLISGGSAPANPCATWIMFSGSWNDAGTWSDTCLWRDS